MSKKLQITNYKLQVQGFTLIELLAVMAIIVSVGTIIGIILFASLRSSTKTNTLNSVRENGNFALTQMAKMIREARRFEGVSTDGVNYTADCTPVAVPTPTPIPTPTQYKYIKITSHDSGQTVFACLAGNTISSQGVSLIDTTSTSVVSCSITCAQSTLSELPIIKIQFTLSQYTSTGTTIVPEKTATIPFQTSVTLRNAQR